MLAWVVASVTGITGNHAVVGAGAALDDALQGYAAIRPCAGLWARQIGLRAASRMIATLVALHRRLLRFRQMLDRQARDRGERSRQCRRCRRPPEAHGHAARPGPTRVSSLAASASMVTALRVAPSPGPRTRTGAEPWSDARAARRHAHALKATTQQFDAEAEFLRLEVGERNLLNALDRNRLRIRVTPKASEAEVGFCAVSKPPMSKIGVGLGMADFLRVAEGLIGEA